MRVKDIKLTTNFILHEFLVGNLDMVPSKLQMENLHALANRLQAIKDILSGKVIKINSGLRSISHNGEVGGKPNSYHLTGMAADIVVVGTQPQAIQHMLRHWSGGLGTYNTFTHIDIGPRRRW